MVIPQDLLEFSAIEKKVQIVGCGDVIELWNPGNFKEMMEQAGAIKRIDSIV